MEWSNPVGSAIGGLFGLVGSAMNYGFSKKLAEQQNEYNLNMWNLQNEYNSPQAQMKRFEEAGLNPALIYSQGNPGNAAQAPQMVTPEAPDVSRDMRELAQAFNIEGLRTAIANRRKAQADAKNAKVDADRNDLQFKAERNVGIKYTFDPTTGRFIERPAEDGVLVIHPSAFYANKILSDQYRTNFLLMPRNNLINSQRGLNTTRRAFIAPQIEYQNIVNTPWRVKTRWWIGNVKDAVQTATSFY